VGGGIRLSTSERREREKAQRRLEILDAARQEFFERGFHRPTVDDIASRAEVSKGTIYLYFESKEEILAHLLLEGLDTLLENMQTAQAKANLPGRPALAALAHTYLRFCLDQPSYFRLIMAFDRGRFEESISPELYEGVLSKSVQALELLATTIRMGAEAGAFLADDPWQAAGSVWAALNGVLVLAGHPLRRQMLRNSTEGMFEATLNLVMRGLEVPAHAH
jgi:AcrR family transcriptional regulator